MHHCCPVAQVPVPGSSSSAARVSAGATAAAKPPASARGHGGSQMCTSSAHRKTPFSCKKTAFTSVNLCSGLSLPNQEAFPLVTILSES